MTGKSSQTLTASDYTAPGVDQASQQRSSYSPPQKKSPWWHSQFNLMLCVFALLAIAVLTFMRIAPEPAATAIVLKTESSTKLNQQNQASATTDSQKKQARSEAQQILSKLLQSKQQLLDKQVELWAAERYQSALVHVAQGDGDYKQQQFQEAITSYQTALDQMTSLQEYYPTIISAQLSTGEIALMEGKSELAKQIYTDLLKIDAQNKDAIAGNLRANNLDQALSHLKTASDHENAYVSSTKLDDLLAAEKQYQQAITIDGKLQQALAGLQRVQLAILEQRYKTAMSKGFNALFASKYTAAKSAFSDALKLKPHEKIAASSYQQVLAASSGSSLTRLISDAKKFEASENWQNALSHYQLVLQRDANQVAAKVGLLRAGVRHQLDQDLQEVISDQLVLSHKDKKIKAEQILTDARAINNKGPKLLNQIQQLESALQQSKIAIKVQLTSDAMTTVSLLKVGANKIQLGQFSKKNLSLKPGKYVATGVRQGFRDVRREIKLQPGENELQLISIQCNEPINNG